MERVLQTTPGQKERRTPIKKPVSLHRLRGRGEGVWSCLEKIYLTPEGFIYKFLGSSPPPLPHWQSIGSRFSIVPLYTLLAMTDPRPSLPSP